MAPRAGRRDVGVDILGLLRFELLCLCEGFGLERNKSVVTDIYLGDQAPQCLWTSRIGEV